MSNDDSSTKKDSVYRVISTRNYDSLEGNESQATNDSTLISWLEDVIVEKPEDQERQHDPTTSNQLFYDNQYQMGQIRNNLPHFPINSSTMINELNPTSNVQNLPYQPGQSQMINPNVPCDMYQYHLYQQQIQQQHQLLQRQGSIYEISPESYLYQQQQIFYEMQLQNLYLQQIVQHRINPHDVSVKEEGKEEKVSEGNIEPPNIFEKIDILKWLNSDNSTNITNRKSSISNGSENKLGPEAKFLKAYSFEKTSKKSIDLQEEYNTPYKPDSKYNQKIKDFALEKWLVEKLDVCDHISIDKPSPAQSVHSGMFTESKSNMQQLWLNRYAPPIENGSPDQNAPPSRFKKSSVTKKIEIWDHGPTHVRDTHVSVLPNSVIQLNKSTDSHRPPILSVKMTNNCRHCIDQRLKDNYLEKLLNLAIDFFLKDFKQMQIDIGQETNDKAQIVDYDLAYLTHFNVEIKPTEGPYKDGIFTFQIAVSYSFPMKPPMVRCLTSIHHPNINNGEIFCNFLSKWNKSSSLLDVIKGLIFLLENPIPKEIEKPLKSESSCENIDSKSYRQGVDSNPLNSRRASRNKVFRSKSIELNSQFSQQNAATSYAHKRDSSKISFRIPQYIRPPGCIKRIHRQNSELFENLYNRSLIENKTPENEGIEMAVQLNNLTRTDSLLDELPIASNQPLETSKELDTKELQVNKTSDFGQKLIKNLNLPDDFHLDDGPSEVMIFSTDRDENALTRPLVVSSKEEDFWVIFPLQNRTIRFTLLAEHFFQKYKRIFDRVTLFDSSIRLELCGFTTSVEIVFELIKQSTIYLSSGYYVPYVRTNISKVVKDSMSIYTSDNN